MKTAALKRVDVHPVTAYALDVVEGCVVTGRPVLWACQRHLDDLENGHKRGLYFDESAADHVFRFFGLLHHFEGELGGDGGQPIKLEPWQKFILGSIFGWKRADGSRRFRVAWVRIARKNGKSLLAAGVGNYLLVADGEPGAQVYSGATKRDQARVIHRAAIAMRDKSPSLRKVVVKMRDRLVVESTRSFFAPLGKDSKTEDGLNPHGATLDEIHAHPDAGLWNVLQSGMGARRQPLIFAVTSAGYGVNTFGRQQDDYYRQVVDPKSQIDNDAAFVYIAELDEKDDPYDPKHFRKPNPNLGVSVKLDALIEDAKLAQDHPPYADEFLTKRANRWRQAGDPWLSLDRWDVSGKKHPVDRATLKGRPCYGGLDLSETSDVTAFVRYFPPWGRWTDHLVLWHFWMPEDRVAERWKKAKVDYQQWIKAGFIEAQPGGSIDQVRIYKRLRDELLVEFPLQLLAYDPTDALMLATLLEADGVRLEKFGQGFSSYNAPTREMERLVFEGLLGHGDNPVARWMAGNVVLKVGVDGDVMPSKGRSAEKIDGIVALIMAIGAAARHPAQQSMPPILHKLPSRMGGGKRPILNAFK